MEPRSYQDRVLSQILAGGAAQVHILSAPVGTGRSTTLALLAERWVTERRGPVLFVAPPSLLDMYVHRLGDDVPVTMVRSKHDLLRLGVVEPEVTGRLGIVLLSAGTLARPAFGSFVRDGGWSLVVIDEAHRLSSATRELVESVAAGGPTRIVLSSAMPINLRLSVPAREVGWTWDDLVGAGLAAPIVTVETATYRRDPAEEALLTEVLTALEGRTDFASVMLWRGAGSSRYQLLESLASLRRRATVTQALEIIEDEVEEPSIESVVEPMMSVGQVDALVERLEELGDDPKLTRAREVVRSTAQRVIVISQFRATLVYASSALEADGHSVRAIHGGMPSDERTLNGERAVLVTDAIVPELDVSDDHTQLWFDLPWPPDRAAIRRGLAQPGRRVRVVLLLPDRPLLPGEDPSTVELIRNRLRRVDTDPVTNEVDLDDPR